jgi:hypothetical protein
LNLYHSRECSLYGGRSILSFLVLTSLDSPVLYKTNYIYCFTKHASLIGGLTVLSLPLMLVSLEVNVIKLSSFFTDTKQNKIGCLSLTSFFSQVKYLWVRIIAYSYNWTLILKKFQCQNTLAYSVRQIFIAVMLDGSICDVKNFFSSSSMAD